MDTQSIQHLLTKKKNFDMTRKVPRSQPQSIFKTMILGLWLAISFETNASRVKVTRAGPTLSRGFHIFSSLLFPFSDLLCRQLHEFVKGENFSSYKCR